MQKQVKMCELGVDAYPEIPYSLSIENAHS